MPEMTQREMNDVYRMIRENQDLMPVINTDPTPSAAAMRLAKIALRRIRGVSTMAEILGVALALDDAGVGKAVEHLSALARLAYAEGEPDSNVWVRKTRLALAALTGEGDAT